MSIDQNAFVWYVFWALRNVVKYRSFEQLSFKEKPCLFILSHCEYLLLSQPLLKRHTPPFQWRPASDNWTDLLYFRLSLVSTRAASLSPSNYSWLAIRRLSIVYYHCD